MRLLYKSDHKISVPEDTCKVHLKRTVVLRLKELIKRNKTPFAKLSNTDENLDTRSWEMKRDGVMRSLHCHLPGTKGTCNKVYLFRLPKKFS